jgi:MFS family permease
MKKSLPIFMSYVVFGFAALFYFFDFFLQVSPGVIAKSLTKSFSMGAGELSLLSACYYFSYTLMQIPAGLLYDRFGGRAVVFCATMTASLGAFLFGVSEHMIWAVLSRLLIGTGSAFAFLGALYFTMRWFPGRYFATLAGVTALIGSIGAMCGETILGYMVHDYGWRNTMVYISFGGGVLALVIGAIAKNHPYDDSHLTKKETRASLKGELRYLFSHAQVWWLGLYAFLSWSTVSVFAVLWGIPFLRRADSMTLIEASVGISVLWVGVGIGSPLIGWLSDYFKRRKLPLILCSCLAIIVFFIILYVPHLSFVSIYSLLFFVGVTAAGVTVIFAAAKDNVPIQTQNLTNGLINMMAVLSGLILQPLIGFLMHALWQGHRTEGLSIYTVSTYRHALLVLPLTAILSLLIAVFKIKETYCEDISKKK